MRTLKRFALCLLALFCCVLPVNAAAQSLAAELQLNACYTLMTLSLSESDFEAALDYADQCLEMDELLDDGQGPVTRLAEGKPDTDKMLLRIRVNGGGEGKEKVNINLPVKLIEILVSNDALMNKIGGGKSDWIKSIDFKQILTLISLGVTGKLVEVQGDEGETVEVWVE